MKTIFVIFLLSFNLAFSATEDQKAKVISAVDKYRSSTGVQAEIKKTITLGLLEETKSSVGLIYLSQGQIRIEVKKPDPSIIIMTKDVLWVVTPTGDDFEGETQVMKIKSSELSKQAKAPLALLLGSSNAWKLLKVEKLKNLRNKLIEVTLKPIKKESLGELTEVKVVLNEEDNTLKSLSYSDELENKTEFEFLNTKFDAKIDKKMFAFTPAKNAHVTEY